MTDRREKRQHLTGFCFQWRDCPFWQVRTSFYLCTCLIGGYFFNRHRKAAAGSLAVIIIFTFNQNKTTMKKILFTLTVITLTTFAFGQVTTPDSTKKEFKNVISIDATGLLKQFLNLSPYTSFNSPYMISYKRIFKSNAFRIGVGGNIYNNNGTSNDTLKGKQNRIDLNIGVGFEHYSYLSKRWNFYYGADVIVNYTYNNYQSDRTATTSWQQYSTAYGYGVSPLFGVQFKINSRLSIATETSYDVTYTQSEGKSINTPPSIYDNKTKSTGINSQFNAPTEINIRIKF
jgi:hypothetical protein